MSTFPVDTCVVACSGPSLNKVDVFSLGVPVCAISTAIRSITEPHYWFLADFLNEMHGEEGKAAWGNMDIVKVIPETNRKGYGNNIIGADYMKSKDMNPFYETVLFDPSKPILRGPHKTITFAIQWLHLNGVKNIIFAGNDLKADTFDQKYSYQIKEHDKKKQKNFVKTIDQVKDALKLWYPLARAKGYNWYSWECGPIFEEIVPKFTEDMLDSLNVNVLQPELLVVENNSTNMSKVHREDAPLVNSTISSQQLYFDMLKQARANKTKFKDKVNMNLYFDLLRQRRNSNK